MIRAYHLIMTTYGFWLPNDPRGSWSDFVRAWELRRFGRATKTTARRSVAHRQHDQKLRHEAKSALSRSEVVLTGEQAQSMAKGFAERIKRSGYWVYACSILPQHVHMVIGRHRYPVGQMAQQLKASATIQLRREGLHPCQGAPDHAGQLPTPWARKCRKRFLNTEDAIRSAVRYVRNNPIKEGKPAQHWSFVVPFDV